MSKIKAYEFFAITDDRCRVTLPFGNRKRLANMLNKNLGDFDGIIIEFKIKSIRFRDGTVVNSNK